LFKSFDNPTFPISKVNEFIAKDIVLVLMFDLKNIEASPFNMFRDKSKSARFSLPSEAGIFPERWFRERSNPVK
jgi:hypothetical protein